MMAMMACPFVVSNNHYIIDEDDDDDEDDEDDDDEDGEEDEEDDGNDGSPIRRQQQPLHPSWLSSHHHKIIIENCLILLRSHNNSHPYRTQDANGILWYCQAAGAQDVEGTCGVGKACSQSRGCGFEGGEDVDVVCVVQQQALHLERV